MESIGEARLGYGWDAPERHVCPECLGDEYFWKEGAGFGSLEGRCDYCDRVAPGSGPVSRVVELVAPALHRYFRDPGSAGAIRDEGEWLLDTIGTEEALRTLWPSCGVQLLKDVAGAFRNSQWVPCNGHFLEMHESQRFTHKWHHFGMMAKHRTRYFLDRQDREFGHEPWMEYPSPSEFLARIAEFVVDQALFRPMDARQTFFRARCEKAGDVEIEDLGVVEAGQGTLYFARRDQEKRFEFDLLSSGEKEEVDPLLDLYLRREVYDDTVFLIDEPELHLNTAIQRKLLKEIDRLVGKDCQIWVATHSVGFLRALQDDLEADCQVIDFGEAGDFGTSLCTLQPMLKIRANWKSLFETALDDRAGLICPKRLVYCEGKPESRTGEEKGLDANVYNTVFGETYGGTLFVSSGGSTQPEHASELGIVLLVDRDFASGRTTTQNDRRTYLENHASNHRVLVRREIENYLYDREVLKPYCNDRGLDFDGEAYSRIVDDIADDNVKDRTGAIKRACGIKGSVSPYHFKLQLATYITPDTPVYGELEACIFCGR